MNNLKNMILEFHGQLEQFTKEMKSGKKGKLLNVKVTANKLLMSLESATCLVAKAISAF